MTNGLKHSPASTIDVREVGGDANQFEFRTVPFKKTPRGIDKSSQRKLSVIVAAYNEQETIVQVLRAVEGHPLVDEIIVVDDGSTDGTADRAARTSAKVIRLKANGGKAGAMDAGVRASRNDAILFLDADIVGLTHKIITLTTTPVLTGRCAMFVAIRARHSYWLNRLLYFIPVLGGERALSKDIWEAVPRLYRKGFQIEIALNYYTKKSGRKMGFAVMPGLSQVIKERKRGFCLGLWQRLKMCGEVLWISFRLYIVRFVLDLVSPKLLNHQRKLTR
jgi:polyprenyl-phospho-N-acetylgalactosaminyl synthase